MTSVSSINQEIYFNKKKLKLGYCANGGGGGPVCTLAAIEPLRAIPARPWSPCNPSSCAAQTSGQRAHTNSHPRCGAQCPVRWAGGEGGGWGGPHERKNACLRGWGTPNHNDARRLFSPGLGVLHPHPPVTSEALQPTKDSIYVITVSKLPKEWKKRQNAFDKLLQNWGGWEPAGASMCQQEEKGVCSCIESGDVA